MGIFQQFPYTNFHEMNLDQFLKEFKNLISEWQQYNTEWESWQNDINATIEEFRTLLDQDHMSEYIRIVINDMIEDGSFQDILAAMLNNEFIDGDYNITRFNNADSQETFVFWRKIPAEFTPYIAYASGVDLKSPVELAAVSGACSAVNASRWHTDTGAFYGYFRANSETINNNEFEDPQITTNSRNILCCKNGLLSGADITTPTVDLDAAEYDWALTGFETIIENSLPKPRATAGGPEETTDLHPRSFIAQNIAGEYFIGSTDGRSGRSEGFRLSDITRFLISLNENITYAYSLDGGGSVALYEKGYHVNTYINNEKRDIKSVICFKKPDGYFSNVLKQALANEENIYRGRVNSYEYKEGNIYSYSDLTTKEINFRALEGLGIQAWLRWVKNRFFIGVGTDFTDDGVSYNLIDVAKTYFSYIGINRYLIQEIYNTDDLTDAFPTAGKSGIWRVQVSSGTVAQNLGMASTDYGRVMYIRLRGTANYDLILTRAHVYYRYDNGTLIALN